MPAQHIISRAMAMHNSIASYMHIWCLAMSCGLVCHSWTLSPNRVIFESAHHVYQICKYDLLLCVQFSIYFPRGQSGYCTVNVIDQCSNCGQGSIIGEVSCIKQYE